MAIWQARIQQYGAQKSRYKTGIRIVFNSPARRRNSSRSGYWKSSRRELGYEREDKLEIRFAKLLTKLSKVKLEVKCFITCKKHGDEGVGASYICAYMLHSFYPSYPWTFAQKMPTYVLYTSSAHFKIHIVHLISECAAAFITFCQDARSIHRPFQRAALFTARIACVQILCIVENL